MRVSRCVRNCSPEQLAEREDLHDEVDVIYAYLDHLYLRGAYVTIVYGHFPWRLLYLPLAAAIVAGIAYVTFTDGWDRPIPPGLYWFAAAFTAWWAFLVVRSGVVPSSAGATYRDSSPIVFWCVVVGIALMSLFFVVVAVDG